MAKTTEFTLAQDKKGVVWDLLLYIPTLIVLILIASQLWYNDNENFTYLLVFLTTIIFLIGFDRIAKTRLMILPNAPVGLSVSKQSVTVQLKSGNTIELVKDVRFFTDFAGKSFGLTGIDLTGTKKQFVFHKGQFALLDDFENAKSLLRGFK
jgi:hypothetical protein